MSGRFIVFEGLDTETLADQASRLAKWYKTETDIRSVVLTREPSEGLLGAQLRFIHRTNSLKIHQYALAAAENADRYYHLSRENGILDKLNQGNCVISVHYLLHTFLYQSSSLSLEWLLQINQNCIWPDVIFFIDTPVASILTKLVYKQGFDSKEVETQQSELENDRKSYLEVIEILSQQGKKIEILEGESSASVHNKCVEYIENSLRNVE
jgi:thymidylate kinase